MGLSGSLRARRLATSVVGPPITQAALRRIAERSCPKLDQGAQMRPVVFRAHRRLCFETVRRVPNATRNGEDEGDASVGGCD